MGSTIKHTDLSWEFPGLRADVDLVLEDTGLGADDPGSWPRVRLKWRDASRETGPDQFPWWREA